MKRSIHLTDAQVRFGWNRDGPPEIVVGSGTEVSLDIQDASAGQITRDSTHESVEALDFERINPVTGPVYVEGAHPGDVLQIDILEIERSDFGWTAQIPGFGLLTEDFPEPWLQLWEIDDDWARSMDGISVPVRPMCGVLGVSPAAPGIHSVVPPRNVGGNLDIRQLGVGATLFLPVEVEGALFGAGDTHAAQGDGEVCGTGIESPMSIVLRLSVRKDMRVAAPEIILPDQTQWEAGGAYVCTGVEPDLMLAAKQAVRSMISHITRSYGLTAEQAYALCSVAVNLRISEVVDAPNWVVSAVLPDRVLQH